MPMKKILAVSVAALAFALGAEAQTNLQFFYDFGKDRKHVTTTVEGFYNDKWGNTFFFIDHDYNSKTDADHTYAPSGTYWEIARCLNFWQNTKFAPLSLHAEYNGGVYKGYTINNAWLFGFDYFIHNKDFTNTLNLKLLYKYIDYSDAGRNLDGSKKRSDVPLQFTVVWGMQDIFGVKGLRFSGFADFWWEDHSVCKVTSKKSEGYRDGNWKDATTVFLSEPQLWYNIGQHIGVDNLNVGTEVELSYNFGTGKNFQARPCLGFKWVF
jgi:hypothetical protein